MDFGFLLTALIAAQVAGAGNIVTARNGFSVCEPDPNGSWFYNDADLFKGTNNIFIGTLIKAADTQEPITLQSNAPHTPMAVHSNGKQVIFYNKKWTFLVKRSFKGDPKQGSEISFTSEKGQKNSPSSFRSGCRQFLNLKEGEDYLIFMNAFNPNAYTALKDVSRERMSKIESLARK